MRADPTDLLHIDGCYTEWDVETARRYAGFYASQCRRSVDEMAAHVLELGTRRLSLELLKRSLDDDTDSDAMEHCAVCRTLVRHLLEEQHPDYEVAVTLKHPVIGIGAPVRYFLPRAAVPLKARAVIPEHADVANAIGAITSHVHIRKGLRIVPGDDGDFIVEGVSGFHRFRNIDDADRFVRRTLAAIVQRKAGEAGTDGGNLTFETRDSRPGGHREEVLERTISASLEDVRIRGRSRRGKAGRLPRPGNRRREVIACEPGAITYKMGARPARAAGFAGCGWTGSVRARFIMASARAGYDFREFQQKPSGDVSS